MISYSPSFLLRALRLRRLARKAEQQPDHWVCETCVTLHGFAEDDHPEQSCFLTLNCPRADQQIFEWAYGDTLHISHRHVQFALKFARLRLEDLESSQRRQRERRAMEELPEGFDAGAAAAQHHLFLGPPTEMARQQEKRDRFLDDVLDAVECALGEGLRMQSTVLVAHSPSWSLSASSSSSSRPANTLRFLHRAVYLLSVDPDTRRYVARNLNICPHLRYHARDRNNNGGGDNNSSNNKNNSSPGPRPRMRQRDRDRGKSTADYSDGDHHFYYADDDEYREQNTLGNQNLRSVLDGATRGGPTSHLSCQQCLTDFTVTPAAAGPSSSSSSSPLQDTAAAAAAAAAIGGDPGCSSGSRRGRSGSSPPRAGGGSGAGVENPVVRVAVYKELGWEGMSPLDSGWRAHVFRSGGGGQTKKISPPWSEARRGRNPGGKVRAAHDPGSVRRAFEWEEETDGMGAWGLVQGRRLMESRRWEREKEKRKGNGEMCGGMGMGMGMGMELKRETLPPYSPPMEDVKVPL